MGCQRAGNGQLRGAGPGRKRRAGKKGAEGVAPSEIHDNQV